MCGGTTEEGICFIEFTDRIRLEREMQRLSGELQGTLRPGEHPFLSQLENELHEYFNRQRKVFSVPLQLTGTDFQKSVWKALLEIPFGTTASYKQQAIKLNKLSAIRAVAAANGQNKHAILIPCHRVIGSNGKLVGYAGGLGKKEWLLDFEKDKTGHTLSLDFE